MRLLGRPHKMGSILGRFVFSGPLQRFSELFGAPLQRVIAATTEITAGTGHLGLGCGGVCDVLRGFPMRGGGFTTGIFQNA